MCFALLRSHLFRVCAPISDKAWSTIVSGQGSSVVKDRQWSRIKTGLCFRATTRLGLGVARRHLGHARIICCASRICACVFHNVRRDHAFTMRSHSRTCLSDQITTPPWEQRKIGDSPLLLLLGRYRATHRPRSSRPLRSPGLVLLRGLGGLSKRLSKHRNATA